MVIFSFPTNMKIQDTCCENIEPAFMFFCSFVRFFELKLQYILHSL